jgi:acetyl esterase/lipase
MTKYALSTLFLALFAGFSYAQNPGCDGNRYINDIFPTVKKTTVTYAPSLSHTGVPMTLQMDVYEPEGDQVAARPVIIFEHGGSFIFGDRSMMQPWCELMAKKGYVTASITYRLYPFFLLGFPDSLDIFDTAVKAVGDMRAAVRYFREDAATANLFKADPNNIFIGGYSAGAVAAMHCSYLDMEDNMPPFLVNFINQNGGLEGVSGSATNKTYSSASKAVVNMSGGLYRANWIEAGESPMISIHGTADETVPFNSGLAANIAYLQGSNLLHARAEEAGVWNSLHVVPGGGHTNIYENASYKSHRDTFWNNVSLKLEEITCSASSAAPELSALSEWSMAPNPVTGDVLSVTLPEGTENTVLRVYNSTGSMVREVRLSATQQTVSLGGLPAGMYLVMPENTGATRIFAAKSLMIVK